MLLIYNNYFIYDSMSERSENEQGEASLPKCKSFILLFRV